MTGIFLTKTATNQHLWRSSNKWWWSLTLICQIYFGKHKNMFVYRQCCRKCKILARLTDHLWLMVGWSVSVLGSPPINNLLRPCNQSKNGQNGPNGIRILLRHNGHLISVHLWNCLSTFITKHFLQNLKNSLVAKRTIYGWTLGHLVDWWVAFGDRATVFQQHWLYDFSMPGWYG